MHCRIALLILLIVVSPLARAALHQCTDATGATRYSDRPCPAAETVEIRDIDSASAAPALSRHAQSLPGIDPSWLDTPAHLTVSARCFDSECRCGEWQFSHHANREYRLINALRDLPDAWESYRRQADEVSRSPAAIADLGRQAALREAACAIRVEQTLIVELFPQIVPGHRESRTSALEAQERAQRPCPRPADGLSARHPAWQAFRDCEQRARQALSSSTSLLSRTSHVDRALDEGLAPLAKARPQPLF